MLNWALAVAFMLAGFKFSGSQAIIFGAIYMLIPMLVALFLQKLIYKEKVKDNLLISFKLNKWFLVAWLLIPVANILVIFVALLIPGVTISPEMGGLIEKMSTSLPPDQLEKLTEKVHNLPPFVPALITLVQGLIAGITINAVFAFGEELGWRGFLLHQFKKLHFMKASLITGFVWGIWHFPIILMGHNYPAHPIAGVFMMTLFCILLSPIFAYITLKSKSVIAAAIMHGSLNGTVGLSMMLLVGGSDLTIGITGISGFALLTLLNVVIFLIDKYWTKENIWSKTIES